MTEVEMVVIDGVRYRPEDAPKTKAKSAPEPESEDDGAEVQHKMRAPRKSAARKRSE